MSGETRGWGRALNGTLRRAFYIGRFVCIEATISAGGPPWRYRVERLQKPENGTWAQSTRSLIGGETVQKLRHAKVFAVRIAQQEEAKALGR